MSHVALHTHDLSSSIQPKVAFVFQQAKFENLDLRFEFVFFNFGKVGLEWLTVIHLAYALG
jgi:hypothetical protein